MLRRLSPAAAYRSFMANMDSHKASKYSYMARLAYFFTSTSLVIWAVAIKQKYAEIEANKNKEAQLEAGLPLIEDESEAHAKLRESGKEVGVIYKYTSEKGWHLEEYHRAEYLQRMEKKAFERAREAQRKALEEGKELPTGAILLVNEEDAKKRAPAT